MVVGAPSSVPVRGVRAGEVISVAGSLLLVEASETARIDHQHPARVRLEHTRDRGGRAGRLQRDDVVLVELVRERLQLSRPRRVDAAPHH